MFVEIQLQLTHVCQAPAETNWKDKAEACREAEAEARRMATKNEDEAKDWDLFVATLRQITHECQRLTKTHRVTTEDKIKEKDKDKTRHWETDDEAKTHRVVNEDEDQARDWDSLVATQWQLNREPQGLAETRCVSAEYETEEEDKAKRTLTYTSLGGCHCGASKTNELQNTSP